MKGDPQTPPEVRSTETDEHLVLQEVDNGPLGSAWIESDTVVAVKP